MKLKVHKNKRKGEYSVMYMKLSGKDAFRYALLDRIAGQSETDVTLIIDTNHRTAGMDFAEMERVMDEAGISYVSGSIPQNVVRVLSVSTNFLRRKKRKQERIYVMDIQPGRLNQTLFDTLLRHFDIGIGLCRQVDIEAICEGIKTEPDDDYLFEDGYFEDSVYDSILCHVVRSTVDITAFVRDMKVR